MRRPWEHFGCGPELVAQVQFSTWTADNLVRQASFKGLREDKKPTEVRREVPDPSLSQKPAEPKSAPPKLGFKVTHPDKVIDPETGLKKQALIDYYLAVAKLMLPHVEGRPLSLVRCPSGAGKKLFLSEASGPGNAAWDRGCRDTRQEGEGLGNLRDGSG